MNAKVAIVATGILVSAVAAIVHVIHQRWTTQTNNPNVKTNAENFRVHVDATCPICLESLDVRRPNVSLLPCGHFLHDNCLKDMIDNRDLLQTNRCPTCRTPF